MSGQPFLGHTHDEVLELELPEDRQLVRDLVPVGVVGTIAGVPETHKSWLAHQIAVGVATGRGTILSCDVITAGPVGYFWQDDSTREEAERVKAYEAVHTAAGASLNWFLNRDVQLPRDIDRLVATILEHGLVLVILDSFYNFLPGIDLKDEAAERIVAELKRRVADATGCTVLIVDHMPWATDTNRGRFRAYGGVFKNAATRFGIYIDANGDRLTIEARGNNIRGFKRRPAYWDADALELRLVAKTPSDEKIAADAAKVADYLEANPGEHSTTALRSATNLGAESLERALEVLLASDRVRDRARRDATGSVSAGHAHAWVAAIHAAPEGSYTLSLLTPTETDNPILAADRDNPVPSLNKGQGQSRQGPEPTTDEQLEALLNAGDET